MLSAFYLGTGGYDIGGMASFFCIPGGRGFERTFHTHSSTIHRVILDECYKILEEDMNEEIIATIKNKLKGSYSDADIMKYSNDFIQRKFDNLPDELKSVGIEVSYDMGWNKRSTGRVYDSLSGHAFMIGCRTVNVIDMGVSKKKYKICQKVNYTGINIEHECNINATGSSGAMESEVALRLTTALHEKWGGRVFICGIVSEDDSTMRAYLQHTDNNAKGKLDVTIPEPTFMADPSHRIKVMSAPIFAMVTKVLDPNKCEMIDAMRVKKYVVCCILKNNHLPLDQFHQKMRAPLEHLFNNHEWCDGDWCWEKELDSRTFDMILKMSKPVDAPPLAPAAVASPPPAPAVALSPPPVAVASPPPAVAV